MKIFVRAKPKSKIEKVERVGDNEFVVAVRESPVGGRANQAIIKALASHLKIKPSRIRIKTGHTSRNKIVEIFE